MKLIDWLGTTATSWRIGRAILDASGLTAARTHTLPDASGTLALEGASNTVTGLVNLLSADETDSSEHNTSTAESAALKTYSLAANSYDYILIEAVVRSRNNVDANNKPELTWRIYEGAVERRAYTVRLMGSNTNGADSGDTFAHTLSTRIAGGQGSSTDLTITVQPNVSNADVGGLVHAFRVYGVKDTTVGSGPEGDDGDPGESAGIQFAFSTTTTDADPGNGALRFNHATIASVTQMFVDDLDADGVDVSAWLDSLDDSTNPSVKGTIIIQGEPGSPALAVFNVTGSVTAASGYRKIAVAYVSGALPANAQAVRLNFSRAGNLGATGADGDLTQATADTLYQPLDSDLTALAGNSTNGLWARTGAGTGTARTITGPAAGISVSNGNGVSGNPTLALANDLAALEALPSTGLAARTGADTWAQRAITGTANEISVADGGGASGNPTISLPSSITLTGKTMTGGTFNSGAFNGTLGASAQDTAYVTTLRTSGNVGIGTAPSATQVVTIGAEISGLASITAVNLASQVKSSVTGTLVSYGVNLTTEAAAFSIGSVQHFRANGVTPGSGASIGSQYAVFVTSSMTQAGTNVAMRSDLAEDTNVLGLQFLGTAFNQLNGPLGIGTSALGAHSLRVSKAITGGSTARSVRVDGVIQSDVTSDCRLVETAPSTLASAFTLSVLHHFLANFTTLGAGSAITTQYGFHAASGLTQAGTNIGFYGNISQAAGRYNFFADGTADNRFDGLIDISTVTSGNGGQIKFPSTANLSSDANTLDDYQKASYTAIATGMTTSPSGTFTYTIVGNTVTINCVAIGGTSNATTFTLTGMPAEARPATTKRIIVPIINNGASAIGLVEIGTAGTLTVLRDSVGTAWTNSGAKSIHQASGAYTLV